MKYNADYKTSFRILKGGKISMMVSALLVGTTISFASPTGGQVTTGSATITQNNSITTINQSSNKASINWQDFSIGKNETVNFNQPSASSVTLNRVVGATPSLIQGAMNANGQVILVNPNGVVFTKGSQINVGGIVASTQNITDKNFQDGNYVFEGDSQNSVINMGTITASNGGYVAMIGKTVVNEGSIVATMGKVELAGGSKISLNLNGNSLVKLTIDEGVFNALVENKGIIKADGGQVILTTAALNKVLDGMVNNTGIIEAQGLASVNGVIQLLGDGGEVTNSGKLDVSSLADKGGDVTISADTITLTETSIIDAKGKNGGGNVLVGGDWQGSGTMHQATKTTMLKGASIDASALESGDGGKVVLWSDIHNAQSKTITKGSVLANGGAKSGKGGKVETSGHDVDIDGFSVNTLAPQGEAGLWLIDPYNYVIGSTQASTIATALKTASVTITTVTNNTDNGATGDDTGAGDITLNSPIYKMNASSDTTLTLEAARNIKLNDDAYIFSNSGKLNVNLRADTDGNGDGIIYMASQMIGTSGGYLTFGQDGKYKDIGGQTVRVGGDVFFQKNSEQTLSTNGGAVNIYGETIVSNNSGLKINSFGGNVNFHGLLNSGNQYTWVDKTGSAGNGTWDAARAEAISGGGYLVTITSRLENSIAGLAAGYRGGWIGAWRADSNNHAWSWADGPEAGQVFFTQNASGGGGTTASGYYSNFGSNEPNGALRVNTERSQTETSGQLFGSAGQWNDLSLTTQYKATQTGQHDVLGFVRETNLAASPVTINAGSGAVTISGGVGASKALSSFNVTSSGTTINGNALVTTGAQNYSSGLNANAGTANFRMAGTSITAGGTVSLSADSITTEGSGLTLSAGTNNILIRANQVNGGKITINTTGALTYEPLGTNWMSDLNMMYTLNFLGDSSSGNFIGSVDNAYSDVRWLNINNIANLGGLTLGKTGNTTGIGIDSALGIAGAINLYGNNIAVKSALSTTNTISLAASETITQTAAITADKLALLGGTTITLNNTNNAIGTLAASNVGNLNYTDKDALIIGAVGSTNGISASGTVSVSTLSGDLGVNKNVSTTDTSASALVLNAGKSTAAGTATGGNILLTPSTTITVGGGGTAKLYSGSIAGSTALATYVGSGSGRFRYASDETTTGYTKALGTGLNTIYREKPTASVTVANKSMTYGETLVSLSGVVTGAINGDEAEYIIKDRLNSASGNIKVKAGGYELDETGLAALGYTSTVTTGLLTVNTKEVSLTGLLIADKTYDKTATATVGNAGTLSGKVTGDALDLVAGTATFDTVNAGANKVVTVSGLTLSGNDKDNYTIADQTTTGTINKATLTLAAVTDTKVYDATTDSSVAVSKTGLAGSDTITGTLTQSFDKKNVQGENGSTLSVNSGYVVSDDNDGNNYNVVLETATGTITPKALSVSGLVVASKEYDANVYATLTTAGTIDKIGSDAVTFGTVATFTDKNVETSKLVNLGHTLSGDDASNYTLADASSVAIDAKITAKTIALSASKTYDGTTDLTGNVIVATGIGSETLTYTGATSSNAHVAQAGKFINAITLADGTNDGLASNYVLPTLSAANAAVTINAVTLSPMLTNASTTKTYDGTTNAPTGFTPTWSFTGLVAGDTAATLGISGMVYNNKNVANASKITVSGLSVEGIAGTNGSLSSDYVLDTTSKEVGASISKATLDVTANDLTKVYGETGATLTYTATGLVGTDELTGSLTRTTGENVAEYVITQNTAFANSNYTISFTDGKYTITPKAITVSASDLTKIYGEVDPTLAYAITAGSKVGSDDLGVNLIRVAGESVKTGGYIISNNGALNSNYDVTFNAGTLTITPKAITVSADNLSKVYGETDAALSYTANGLINSDTLSGSLKRAAGKDVAEYVITQDTTLSNSNYIVAFTNGKYTITPKSLSISGITAATKVYDGSTLATTNDTAVVKTGLVTGDILTVATTGIFDNKNVGTNKTVTLTSSYSGADVGNYTIANQDTTTADVTKLGSVEWIGGATGNWFDSANWAGGAVPDLSNVANVIIPDGVVVSFDTSGATGLADASSAVNIDSLGSLGSMTMTNGALNVTNDITLDTLTQTGGDISGADDIIVKNLTQSGGTIATDALHVSDSFAQSGTTGNIAVTNNAVINQTIGDMTLGNISTGTTLGATAQAGNIAQVINSVINATGAATLAATNGNIALNSVNNDFNTVNASGVNVVLADKDEIELGNIIATGTLGVNAATDITQTTGTTITATLATTLASTNNGDIKLDGTNNDFSSIIASGKDVTLTDANGIELGTITTTGTLGVNAVDSITQTAGATITAALATTLASTNGNIALSNANNDFQSTVNASGGNIALEDKDSITLGNITSTGTLGVTATTDITQTTGTTITAALATTLAATTGNIALDSTTNDFVGTVNATGANVTLADTNGMTAVLHATGDSILNSGGALDVSGITQNLTTTTTNGGTTNFGATTVAGALETTSTGAVTQSGALAITGVSTINATGQNVALNNSANDFKNTVNASGKDVALADANGVELGNITTIGTLGVAAVGNITQSGTSVINATGETTLASTTGDIKLDGANNDFSSINVSGKDVALADKNGIELGTVTSSGTLGLAAVGNITQSGTSVINATGETTLASTTGNVKLDGANNDFSTINVSGKDVALADKNGIELGTIASSGTLGVNAVADITQTAGKTITANGATTLASTSGNIALDNGTNDFKNTVNASGSNVALADANGVTLGNVTAAGTLGVSTKDSITQNATSVINASGITTLVSTSGDVKLDGANNDFSTVNASGANVALADKNDMSASLTATGDSTLNSGGALDVSGTTKNLTTTTTNGGTTNFGTTTVAGSLNTTSTGNVTQSGALATAGISNISATGKDVILNNASNDFVGAVSLTGAKVAIVDANALTLGTTTATSDLTLKSTGKLLSLGTTTVGGAFNANSANGNIIQTGPLTVMGASIINAGSGKVTLINPSNNISGGVNITASSSTIVGNKQGNEAAQKAEKVITNITSGAIIPSVQMTFTNTMTSNQSMSTQAPRTEYTSKTLPTQSSSGEIQTYTLVGTSEGKSVLQNVSMEELQKDLPVGQEVRVPVGQDSVVELINGGIKLPDGVSQEFYIVADNNTDQDKK